ncbi:hypothetical protein ZEAMMB73_Zm00001d042101, partial [Zea mays]
MSARPMESPPKNLLFFFFPLSCSCSSRSARFSLASFMAASCASPSVHSASHSDLRHWCHRSYHRMYGAYVQERSIHLGQVNSFTEVLRSILQEVLRSNSPAKRTKAEKLSQRGSIISAKRTNMDEDILTKAQRLAAKHNLEI